MLSRGWKLLSIINAYVMHPVALSLHVLNYKTYEHLLTREAELVVHGPERSRLQIT